MNAIKYPVITLVGQRNVGKSTLFNRLTQTNHALVADYSGLTRDRLYGYIHYKKNKFIVIDTGGFDILSKTTIQNDINNQIILAIKSSHIILFIVNGKYSESSVDYDIINYLRKLQQNIFVIVNKMDNILYDNEYCIAWDYYSLGIQHVICISAMHGYGIDNLLKQISLSVSKKICNSFQKQQYITDTDIVSYKNFVKKVSLNNKINFIRLAIVGRPNCGKSTFVNYISKTNRMTTSKMPGTTRDSVYIPVMYNNHQYILIDTAGVRKKRCIDNIAEQISVSKTLAILKTAHITLFMIDIHEKVVDQDLSLLRFILNNNKSLVIAINKSDTLVSTIIRKKILESLIKKINFLNFSKIHFISSLYGIGIQSLFQSIQNTYQSSIKTINTALLTRIMYKAIIQYPPPFLYRKGITPKLKYVHIGGYNPIIIVVHGTKVSQLPDEYRKYLRKYFYHSLNINGVGLRILFKDITLNPFQHNL